MGHLVLFALYLYLDRVFMIPYDLVELSIGFIEPGWASGI
jgi:hypothetical protein